MENRIEILREYIDNKFLYMKDNPICRSLYLHLYGVSQCCTLIALKRSENVELATMAGMLHDLYTFIHMDSKNHAEKGAVLARNVLDELKLTTDDETNSICSAIHNHSSKGSTFSSFEEVLIDADVLHHYLYDVSSPIMEHEKKRLKKLAIEFDITQAI